MLKTVTLRLAEWGRSPTSPVAMAPRPRKSIPAPIIRTLARPLFRNDTTETYATYRGIRPRKTEFRSRRGWAKAAVPSRGKRTAMMTRYDGMMSRLRTFRRSRFVGGDLNRWGRTIGVIFLESGPGG